MIAANLMWGIGMFVAIVVWLILIVRSEAKADELDAGDEVAPAEVVPLAPSRRLFRPILVPRAAGAARLAEATVKAIELGRPLVVVCLDAREAAEDRETVSRIAAAAGHLTSTRPLDDLPDEDDRAVIFQAVFTYAGRPGGFENG